MRSKTLLALVVLLSAAVARAQYKGLSPSFDGSSLIFATELRQNNAEQPAWGKLFVIDDRGLRPFLIRNRDLAPGGTNAYDLRKATYSPDGRWLAITGGAECTLTSGVCASRDEDETTLYDVNGTARLTIAGEVRFSENGRWLASITSFAVPRRIRLFDLSTLTEAPLEPALTGVTIALLGVSNDGAVLAWGYRSQTWLHRSGELPQFVTEGLLSAGGISGDGRTIVLGRAGHILLFQDGLPRDLGEGEPIDLSFDGRRLLFGHDDQLWIATLPEGEISAITTESPSLRSATLSGDGSTVFFVDAAGALMKADVESGAVTELIPAISAPLIPSFSSRLPYASLTAPGEPVSVSWSALVRPELKPEVRVGDLPAPILQTAPNAFVFQAPWRTPSPAQTDITLFLPAVHPVWRTEWPLRTLVRDSNVRIQGVLHEDLRTEVSQESPAKRGELLRVLATGLGPVIDPPLDGEAAPALVSLRNPVQCGSVPVLSAGLAPRLVGYYLIDIRVPETAGTRVFELSCTALDGRTLRIPLAEP